MAEYRAPKIYRGIGDCVIPPPFTPEQADQCLANTKGFRLMGQRFIPDSYMFSQLVGQYTGVYLGNREPRPFTFVVSGAGRPIRGFPRRLDVMALLGSDRAHELLDELDDSNYEFIKNFGEELNAVISDVDEKAKKTTIVADVHTDGNTEQVLEEGVGYVKVPDGRILVGAGPVMSCYEFKHPMAERLTDEKWRDMLGSEPPEKPEWCSSFWVSSLIE